VSFEPMTVWQVALALFLIANPIGNTPAFVALVKDFSFKKQKQILFRESIFSFLIAFVFIFIGEPFLKALQIENYSLSFCGGVLLTLVAINMIFPEDSSTDTTKLPKEPYIVPIATPIITGGGVLSTIMVFASREQNNSKIAIATIIAYFFVTIIVVSAVYLQKILGKRGLIAMEQLMGMMLALLAMQLIVNGAENFFHILNKG
jgi:multiple antibiotic resistance protein